MVGRREDLSEVSNLVTVGWGSAFSHCEAISALSNGRVEGFCYELCCRLSL